MNLPEERDDQYIDKPRLSDRIVGWTGSVVITATCMYTALAFWGGGSTIFSGGGGGSDDGGVVSDVVAAPDTPTIDAVVFAATGDSLRLLGSTFSGDGSDTHDSTQFQVDTAGTGAWSGAKFTSLLGAVETDTAIGLDSAGVFKARVRYKGTEGGWSSWSDSVLVTMVYDLPIATLTPCDYADSAAFWNSGDVLEFGNGASNDRNSVETPTNDPTAFYGCNKAFRHLWTVNTSEAYSGYNWHFNPSGAISTTLREVWLVAWFDMPDSTRTKYGKWGNLHYHNAGKLRLGPGQGGEYTGDPNASSTAHIGFYGFWYAVNDAIGNRPASNQYEERGESPPKGWGLENGTNGHDNDDVPNLRTTFYGQGWKPYCIHHRIPSSWPGAPLVDFWFDGTQLIYEDTVQSNQGADYIEGWAPIENTNIWTANPTTETVVRAGGTVWTGRVDVYAQRPSQYCGS